MAIDTGIFDFGNINFLSDLPGLGPQDVRTKGSVLCQNHMWLSFFCILFMRIYLYMFLLLNLILYV